MITIGVDEAGRGPLIGNVVAAAIILNNTSIEGIDDSKKLNENKREKIYAQLITHCLYAVGEATAQEIDKINIHNATLLAMQRAIEALLNTHAITQADIIVDGKYPPSLNLSSQQESSINIQAVIKADSLFPCVSAASIIAKVTRDRQMIELHRHHPEYGFNQHKGYPTKKHYQAIQDYGTLSEHRKSYRGVN
jgi:ribonuclease HII